MTFDEAMIVCANGSTVRRESWLSFKWAIYLLDDEAKAATDWKIVSPARQHNE
jgi:hypothetical protein